MITIKILLLLIIIRDLIAQFWLRSEFDELKSLCGSDFHSLQKLRYASHLQSRLENERN